MSANFAVSEAFGAENFLTLEDLEDRKYKLVAVCNCCGQRTSLTPNLCIEELGRAFPVHLLISRGEHLGTKNCKPDDMVLHISQG
ncbi:hypothetical protein [Roseibium aggregatum]|uniref:Uncharacterized protein n=1 Tax=Roseibium aggregatum TaxID=187304 RepID=A0A939J700_9HYPH|nr:hypothetical protein [Roseibium aggregatum]MBN9673304.1 hypothetical protein [Roseibium aggregatum]